jgi:hypothetical protein
VSEQASSVAAPAEASCHERPVSGRYHDLPMKRG